jgi:hypothetical protein
MMMKTTMRAAAAVAVLLGFAAAAALADECESMTKGVKVLIDEMRATVGQVGATSPKQLRKITIRHRGALEFDPQSKA